MKRRKSYFDKGRDTENFWPAFTDMITTIAIILFFMMLLAYINNIITGSNLEYARKQLEDTQKNLEASKAEISRAEDQLRLLEIELEDTMAEVKEGLLALKLSQEEVDEQQEIIAESNKELGELRSKLDGIALLRLEVVEKVKDSIEGEMGTTSSTGEELVQIADNGNIIINEGLIFDYDSYRLKEDGKALLDSLAKSFENVLNDETVRNSIDTIVIQGHTDERGSSSYNRDLGAKRANAVLDYMFESNPTLENKYGSHFASSSYSEFRPITEGKTESDYAQNRRIEISITLKDTYVQDIINEYLQESLEFLNNMGNTETEDDGEATEESDSEADSDN